MIELETALNQVLAALPPASAETIPLTSAADRVLAEDIHSSLDLPGFDNSAVDGYAVRAEDVRGTRADAPVALRLVGRVAAGASFSGELRAGECVRLFTGSPVPSGADAVVMQEDARVDSARPNEIQINDAAKPFENVRLRGQDVKHGEALCLAGETLNAAKLALLAATGIAAIPVGCRPRVALLATGSELREAGTPLEAGQIYESNRLLLSTLVARAGGLAEVLPIVRDTLEDTKHALESAFMKADFVVTSGGVSVGELDFVKAAFAELGGKLELWRIAMRPGKPFAFGALGGKFLFGLPGNPVSAFVTFLSLVRPAIRRWQGAADIALSSMPAVLAEPLRNPGERRHFMRVRVGPDGSARGVGLQASHALRSIAEANALVDVPAGKTLPAGERVAALRWD